MIHLYEAPRKDKFIEKGSRIEFIKCWEGGRMSSYCLMGTEFLFRMIKNSGMNSGNGHPHSEYT
jgi:hypothetical protein